MPTQLGLAKPQGLAKLDADIARLQQEIGTLQKRIDGLMNLRSAVNQHKDEFALVAIRKSANAIGASLAKRKKFPTKRDAILNTCKEILADGRRRFARELLPELAIRGVKVGGRNDKIERRNLASYLSHSDAFEANTKLGGWTLRSLDAPKTKAGNGQTLPASTHGALPVRHQLAGLPREGGFQFD